MDGSPHSPREQKVTRGSGALSGRRAGELRAFLHIAMLNKPPAMLLDRRRRAGVTRLALTGPEERRDLFPPAGWTGE